MTCYGCCLVLPKFGHPHVIPGRRSRLRLPRAQGVTSSHPKRTHAMANTDPFSSSVIPFEVPEQMRAFAEKGVSQARDNYAKFKDVAETHNGAIEAMFSVFSSGAKEYSAKVMEMMKSSTSANLDFAQALVGVKSPSEAMELWSSHAKNRPPPPRKAPPTVPNRSRPAPRRSSSPLPPDQAKSPRYPRGFCTPKG